MSDWQVGDLVAYVRTVCPTCGPPSTDSPYANELDPGRIYTIGGFSPFGCGSGAGLLLVEVDNYNQFGNLTGWCAADFRKIRPDEPTECEEEFRILLKLSKKRVSA